MIDTGLYIHIPFCEKKCKYCNFYSIKATDDIIDTYVDVLCEELSLISEKNKEIILKTIYIGGGTPSLLNQNQLDKIFNNINKKFHNDLLETTIEINPNSSDKIQIYPKFGINRLSIGIQSTDDIILKKLGRIHDSSQVLKALEESIKYFSNISADLILGVDSNQNPIKDFDIIHNFVTHISAYMLSVEQNTTLFSEINTKNVSIATEDETIDQYEKFVSYATEKKFFRYEISNFAKLGCESKHNSSYWKLSPYVGIGPGAHSYLNGKRYYNISDIYQYINGNHSGNGKEIIERESNLAADKYEYIMLSLRTSQGIILNEYITKFNDNFLVEYKEKINRTKKYLRITTDSVSIDSKYFLLQNTIIGMILF